MESAPDVFVAIGVSPGLHVRLARTARRWRQIDLAFRAQVSSHDVSVLEADGHLYPAARLRIFAALDLGDLE